MTTKCKLGAVNTVFSKVLNLTYILVSFLPCCTCFGIMICFSVYKIHGRAYPINFLRNMALDSSQGEYVFMVDVDFVPSRHLASSIEKEISQHFSQSSHKYKALVIPAFEIIKVDVTAEEETPSDKKKLLKLLRQGEIIPFMAARWPLGHRATNFSKWYSTEKPYQVFYERDFEPYLGKLF